MTTETATCFSRECNQAWSLEYLSGYFPKSFFQKEYKERMKDIIFDREIAMIPATQESDLFTRCRIQKSYGGTILNIPFVPMNAFQRQEIMVEIRMDVILQYFPRIREQLISSLVVDSLIPWSETALNENHQKLIRYIRKKLAPIISVLGNKEKPKGGYTGHRFHCQVPNCAGICTKSICLVCLTAHCPDCEEIPKEDHKCDPDTIKALSMIRLTSKPCPNCSTMIHKYQGCQQMFCVQCKTRFDWETLKIYTPDARFFHNPHELPRPNQRPDEQPLPEANLCHQGLSNEVHSFYNVSQEDREDLNEVQKYYRLYTSMTHKIETANHTRNNDDLRIKYILGLIGKTRFRTEIYRRWRSDQIRFEEVPILHAFMTLLGDELSRTVSARIPKIQKIIAETNEKLAEVGNRYQIQPRVVNEHFVNRFITVHSIKEIDDILERE